MQFWLQKAVCLWAFIMVVRGSGSDLGAAGGVLVGVQGWAARRWGAQCTPLVRPWRALVHAPPVLQSILTREIRCTSSSLARQGAPQQCPHLNSAPVGRLRGALARPARQQISALCFWELIGGAAMAPLGRVGADQGQIAFGQCRLVYETVNQ